jgi:hypothetical protein
MKDDQLIILQEYVGFKSIFKFQVLGLVEIGSHARDEAVSTSDRDIRLVIRSTEPYVLMKEHAWTDSPDAKTEYVEWADLNRMPEVSFGITNLAWVERCLRDGLFPLLDHTALYQGQLLLDDEGAIEAFRERYARIAFTNIVSDYLRQLDWRVNRRLPAEAEFAAGRQTLDKRKLAIPLVHTCCRILRDIAHIDTYRRYQVYVADGAALDAYYQRQWPGYYLSFRTLFDYKTDEKQRRHMFEQVERQETAALQHLQQLRATTTQLWKEFSESVLYS